MMKIYCQPNDCDSCPYPDCIGEIKIKKKPGRKKLPDAIVRQHRLEYNRKYREEHKEQIRKQNREGYYRRKNEKNS